MRLPIVKGSQPKTGANIGAFRNGIESEEQRKRSAEPGGVHSTRRSLLIGDALSRAPYKQKETAAPLKCRNRIAACDEHPACVRERRRWARPLSIKGKQAPQWGSQGYYVCIYAKIVWNLTHAPRKTKHPDLESTSKFCEVVFRYTCIFFPCTEFFFL